MKLSLALLSLILAPTTTTTTLAFAPTNVDRTRSLQKRRRQQPLASSASSTTSTTTPVTSTPLIRPPRVVRDDPPVVYVYDHCPFCVRVRAALGLKNVKHDVRFMANDDVKTPTALVGRKIAPILEWREADVCMGESLDIIRLLDDDERLGRTRLIAPATGREDIKAWQNGVRELLRSLQRPRYVATGLLPEFQQLDGRHAFVRNHPLPGYDRDAWKDELDLKEQLTLYAELMAEDPASAIEELNRKLVELDDMVYCDKHCSEGGLSMDDIDLFARLRSVTIIQGVKWPRKLRSYMDYMSCMSDVPLYDEMAL